jgi:hypothetical protein
MTSRKKKLSHKEAILTVGCGPIIISMDFFATQMRETNNIFINHGGTFTITLNTIPA